MSGKTKQGKRGGVGGPDRCARERLLAAAADIFSRKGYAATSVGEIVAAAGVTKPVLYYHFESKEGLYLTLMEEGLERFRTAVAAALQEGRGTAAERARRLCATLIDLALEHESITRLTRGIRFAQPQGAPPFDVGVFPVTVQKALLEIVESGVRSGEFRPVPAAELVWVIVGLLAACIDSNLVDPALALKPRSFHSALNIVFAGVAPADRRPQGDR